MQPSRVLAKLLGSSEPALRWKGRVNVLGESLDSRRIEVLQEEVRRSSRVRRLLAGVVAPRRTGTNAEIYNKWRGRHWVLARLADIGYPSADASLEAWRDRVLDFWLRPAYYRELVRPNGQDDHPAPGVPLIEGRYRRCASQQGNALYFTTQLGLDDGRCSKLAERLLHWQWPDGGWNCDTNPSADSSSFNESLLPMLGLTVHGQRTGSTQELEAARRASEIFLRRRLFRRVSDGRVIYPGFVRLRYPAYWHYDVLSCLRALIPLGKVKDPRCVEALEWLERKQLPEGGWPAEAKYYSTSPERFASGVDSVDWGGVDWRKPNPWVTVDALAVLHAAGRVEF